MPDVVLKTTLEGLREALQGLSQIDTALQSIGSRGGSAGPGMGTAGGGAPATASVSPAGIGPSPAPPPPTQPPMPVPGAGAPAAPGVPKLGPGSTQPLQPMGFSQPMGGAMMVANLTITAQNVTLVGGGGTGGGGGGATGGTGSGGGMGPSGAQPMGGFPSPASMMGGPNGAAQFGQGLVGQTGQLGNMALNALMNPYMVGAAAVGMLGYTAANAALAGSRPQWQAGVGIETTQIRGGYISPLEQWGIRTGAELEGAQAGREAWQGLLGPLAGPIFERGNREERGYMARRAASVDNLAMRGRLGATMGMGSVPMAYPGVGGIGGAIDQLLLDFGGAVSDDMLGTREGMVTSVRGLGGRMARGVGMGSGVFNERILRGMMAGPDGIPRFDSQDIAGMTGALAGVARDPANLNLRGLLERGSMRGVAEAGMLMIGQGNMGGLESLRPMFGAQTDEMIDRSYRLHYRLGNLGADSALAGGRASLMGTRAALYGGASEARDAGMMRATGIASEREAIGERMPYANEQERRRLTGQLDALLAEEIRIRESANRDFFQIGRNIAANASAVTGAQRSAAQMQGIGGVAGFGFGQRHYENAQAIVARTEKNLGYMEQQIRSNGGDPMANEEYTNLLGQLEGERANVVGAGIDRANVPLSMPLQRQLSAQGYQLSVMQSLPGTYGNIRQTLQNQIGTLQGAAGEITARMNEQRRLNGGILPDEQAFEYQKQLQNIGSQQAGVFGQLAYGWEGRLMSNAVNTPGSFSWASPMFAYRAAIGAGVKNPHMGSGSSDMPFFMRQAGLIGSIAGATGTPEGFGTTAMTGVAPNSNFAMPGGGVLNAPDLRGSIDGATIHIQMHMPDGSVQTMPGTLKTRSIQADVSPAGLAEASRGVSRMRY